ncbi:MAG TPA: ketoacyl-ACP synthase III [Cyclobacteriaceae bacterium]|nr:ketoacyl-ACP synthase III [Cyclobacteriaceae bacterium]
MSETIYSIITGSGKYLPSKIIENSFFLDSEFYKQDGEKNTKPIENIVSTLQKITEIEERRYVEDEYVTSDLAFFAAQEAIKSAGIDQETLDYIIVAHNFGDVQKDNQRSDMVPTLAARVKYKLGISNPYTVAYDLPFGCPGWVQGVIQADYFIKSGDAKKILVIGAETLSRISDPHDIDSMIFSDGAGAVVLEGRSSKDPVGCLAHITRSDTLEFANLLNMGGSYNPAYKDNTLFIKMNGRKLYEYALTTVPQTLRDGIEKAGLKLADIKKVLIHQANGKMDLNILTRLFDLYGETDIPGGIMPMSIAKLGNNSVATVPILYDLINKGDFDGQDFNSGDHLLFASVGAGMNINVIIYRVP